MRDIKFRGLRTDGNGWVYGDLLQLEKDFKKVYKILHWQSEEASDEVIPESVGQFTGLKDESGNNIYENDILTGGFVVTYNDGSDNANHGMSIGFFQQRNNFESWTELIAGESYVVIGNTHENPELLNTNS